MRNFTESEKEDVKKMITSKGFQILEKLIDEYKVDVMNDMLTLPLGEKETIEKLTGKQNKLLGIREFIAKIKSSTSGIGKKKD